MEKQTLKHILNSEKFIENLPVSNIYVECELIYQIEKPYPHKYVGIFDKNMTHHISLIIQKIKYIQDNIKYLYNVPELIGTIIYEKKIQPQIYTDTCNFIQTGGFISINNNITNITEGFTLVKDFGNLKLTDYPLFSYEDIAHKLEPLNISKPPLLINELKGKNFGIWTVVDLFDNKNPKEVILSLVKSRNELEEAKYLSKEIIFECSLQYQKEEFSYFYKNLGIFDNNQTYEMFLMINKVFYIYKGKKYEDPKSDFLNQVIFSQKLKLVAYQDNIQCGGFCSSNGTISQIVEFYILYEKKTTNYLEDLHRISPQFLLWNEIQLYLNPLTIHNMEKPKTLGELLCNFYYKDCRIMQVEDVDPKTILLYCEKQMNEKELLETKIKEVYFECTVIYVPSNEYKHHYLKIFKNHMVHKIQVKLDRIVYIVNNFFEIYSPCPLIGTILYEKIVEQKIYKETNNFIQTGGFISTNNSATGITEGFTLVRDFGNLKLTDYPLFSYEDIAHKLEPLNISKPSLLTDELKGKNFGIWTVVNVFNNKNSDKIVLYCVVRKGINEEI